MTRHAVYAIPRPGSLADAAARWLGRDAQTGARVEVPHAAWVRSAARYGFHATVVAPMRLRDGASLDDLIAALEAFCAGQPAVWLQGLALVSLDGFLALVPEGPVEALNTLAAAAVRHFAPFRAPLTDSDLARRNPSALTTRQRALLEAWGYPFVMEEFRFHMTLSDRLTPDHEAFLRPQAQQQVAAHVPRPMPIDSLVLCSEDADGVFHHTHRAFLS